jgi:hypothetical protein
MQGPPLLPQAWSLGVAMHSPPWQQPSQFPGPQGSWTQTPFSHFSPLWQAWHVEPLRPQVAAEVTEVLISTQVPWALQHPEQFPGPQGSGDSSSSPQLAVATRVKAKATRRARRPHRG